MGLLGQPGERPALAAREGPVAVLPAAATCELRGWLLAGNEGTEKGEKEERGAFLERSVCKLLT